MKKKLIILTVVALVVGLMGLDAGVVQAKGPKGPACDVTVTAPDSIQAAIDATPEGVVCLDDSGGVFHQSVVFGIEDSGITLTAAPGANPVLDGTDPADGDTTLLVDGIRLLASASNVTIKGLEILNYTGSGVGSGNAIQAWNAGTSNISIIENWMHDNDYNAILVGNEGTGLHTGWEVKKNIIESNGYYGIELTNGSNCQIEKNTVTDGQFGILIQARNTIPGSGEFDPANIKVKHNEVSGASSVGIYVIAQVSEPTDPFNPISDAYTELRTVVLADNNVHDNANHGIFCYGYFGVVVGVTIKHNNVKDNVGHGIGFYNAEWSQVEKNKVSGSGSDGIALYGGASNNDVEKNKVSDSGRYGISLRGEASDNLVNKNKVTDSVDYDLYWDGTGTGNTWNKNKYKTSNF